MGCAFHYLFNIEYAHKAIRYPEKMIDTCIDLYKNKQMAETFGRRCGFTEVDWVFCMNRAGRQTPHRFSERNEILEEFAEGFIAYLENIDADTDEGFNDLHSLFGSVCCLAELQQALPGKIESKKPLKLVLDRRPFI